MILYLLHQKPTLDPLSTSNYRPISRLFFLIRGSGQNYLCKLDMIHVIMFLTSSSLVLVSIIAALVKAN